MFLRILCFYTVLLAIVGLPLDDVIDGPVKISPLPALISLYNTFSISSFGLSPSDQTFEEEDEEPSKVQTLLADWTASLQSDLEKAKSFRNPMASSLYLDNSVKYVVLAEFDFQDALQECALTHKGYLPFEISQLHSAIDFDSIPEKIFLNPKVLLPNEDIRQINTKFRNYYNSCSIWVKKGEFEAPEVINGRPCDQQLTSMCLFSAGDQTYQHKTMFEQVRTGFDTIAQHIIYLLSELKKYPNTHAKIISAKIQHLIDGFNHYEQHVEGQIGKGDFNFGVLFSLQHCLSMVKLALHRSQHGEFWESQTRQQNNFDNIKVYTDQMNLVLESIQRVVENRNCSMSASLPPTNCFFKPSNSSYGNGDNGDDDHHEETTTFTTSPDDETTTMLPSTTMSNHQQDPDDGSGVDDLEEGSTLTGDNQPLSYQQVFLNWLSNSFGSSNNTYTQPQSNSSELNDVADDLHKA